MSGIRNADITIYHHTWDSVMRRDVWTPAQYAAASWHAHIGAVSATNGETPSDHAVVRIYTTAELEVSLGDMLVPCLTDTEVSSLAEIMQFWPNSIKVLQIRDNRRGNVPLQHWRLEGA